MTEDPHERLSVAGAAPQRVSELAEGGVRAVRLQYADLHGICRGKNIPISAFSHAAQDGIGFVAAIMTVDLRHNVVAGFEQGFPDLLARPDLTTLVALPWAPDVVGCLVDLVDPGTHQPSALDSRGALRRILTEFDALEVTPVVGPELEFYLCEPDPAAPTGTVRTRRRTAVSIRSAISPIRGARSAACSMRPSRWTSARSLPPTSMVAASSRSTFATGRR